MYNNLFFKLGIMPSEKIPKAEANGDTIIIKHNKKVIEEISILDRFVLFLVIKYPILFFFIIRLYQNFNN